MDDYTPIVEFIADSAFECGVWGGSVFVGTLGNVGAAGAGCATGVAAYFVEQFTSSPFAQCIVWGLGGITVVKVAVGEALSAFAAGRAGLAGCISGAGSWFLQQFGVSNGVTQCFNWALPAAIAVPGKAWERALAAAAACVAGAADEELGPGNPKE